MSAIRPNLPALLFPPHPAAQTTPVRASRSDFFKVALDSVVQAAPAEPTMAAAAPPPASAAFEARPARPGALLDIRV